MAQPHWGRLVLLTLVLTLFGATAARADVGVYVALGDSYTSAPLVPNQRGDPIDCGRSDRNYPSLVAAAVKAKTFIDVSCGSAQTKHMTEPQTGLPAGGTNPPQFNGLRADAELVTVGIGGNDAGLVGVAETCAQLGATNPNGTACRDRWAPGGNDQVAARIAATAPRIAAVLQGIHQRAPNARVAIVGYPDVLPKNGESCWPMVPLSPDDIRYIDSLLVRINAMIRNQAAANDADFVDTYADSGGHDVCKLPPNRWFEGLVPTEPAYPLHPNAKGEASMARSAIAVLSQPRRGGQGTGGGPVGGGGGQGAGSRVCLARRARMSGRGVGRVRLGATRAALRKIKVRPTKRTRSMSRWCTAGGGQITAVFGSRRRRARVMFFATTAPGHRIRGIHPDSTKRALLRAYPKRVRLTRGLYLSSRRGHTMFGVYRGRVTFMAVASKRAMRSARLLNRGLRLALT